MAADKQRLEGQIDYLETCVAQLENRFSGLLQINHPEGQYKLGPGYNPRASAVFSPSVNDKMDALEQSVEVLAVRMSKMMGDDLTDVDEVTHLEDHHQTEITQAEPIAYADVNTQYNEQPSRPVNPQPDVTYVGSDDVTYRRDSPEPPQDYNQYNQYDAEDDDVPEMQITHL